MKSPRRLAVLCCGLVALGIVGCSHTGGGNLDKELPKELLDVLPLGEKRPVEVVLASPQGDMAALNQGDSIVMAFNQPMVPLKPVSTDVNVDFVEISPKIDGRFRWKGTATLVFEPKVKLPYGTRFKVTVKKGVKSWSEQQMSQDYSFSFVTPTVALEHTLPMESSDMTRTVAIGELTETQARMVESVAAAQRAGVETVRAGATSREVDQACRAVIGEYGWAERFTHGTGHGVGLDIHEAPRVSAVSDATLEPGFVVTVEPGVYIAPHGGVRIEDTVVVTETGCTVLTASPKTLLVA